MATRHDGHPLEDDPAAGHDALLGLGEGTPPRVTRNRGAALGWHEAASRELVVALGAAPLLGSRLALASLVVVLVVHVDRG
eukprot:CAMPEP_0206214058 /NCGR_PEP_ID=MMETSP0047_2-20121206/1460_1 /ASSEMBLY_ACC=CAM_ASM_000192 /TAXON_ID=195065 /ORGANISM="Chroomonas mesostigmatica_cf, Strain CCMP1168" /LENGTH=80 /DNA_ID=CAMNT_0053636263 /DNA_START=212 /DNA_END=450 /DNA_ORIENTATION=+